MENKRLTKYNYTDDLFEKQKELIKIDEYHEIHYSQANYNEDLWNAVKEKEDLEEQIGCPLEVVFKALKDGIYTKESESDNELELFEVRGIEKKGVGVISKFCSYAECDFTCEYKDYKKTWWLKKDKSE